MTVHRKNRRRGAAASRRPALLPVAVAPSVALSPQPPAELRRELAGLVAGGAKVKPAGLAKAAPERLWKGRYSPTTKIELFGTRFYLSDYFQTPQLRFFVAFVAQPGTDGRIRAIWPRIIYKDGSLVWRTASHMVSSDDDFWIGKGDIRSEIVGDEELYESVESTTDLPFEMQTALEEAARRTIKVRNESRALDLVLRNAPPSRIRAYPDFTAPREAAAADPRNLPNGGRSVARFRRVRGRKDPASLVFAKGYEPDFDAGIVEVAESKSVLYGGRVGRWRVLSRNRRIQYLFLAGSKQVWIIPPQATTTVLSTFGVRTVDVVVDDDLCVPGMEYHFLDDTEDPPVFYSQIPEGYAGELGEFDKSRADASPWLDRLPVIAEFRRKVLAKWQKAAGAGEAGAPARNGRSAKRAAGKAVGRVAGKSGTKPAGKGRVAKTRSC